MKKSTFIYIVIMMTACNTPSTPNAVETNIESETAAADIIKKIEEKPPIKKEDLKITEPYGKLLYTED